MITLLSLSAICFAVVVVAVVVLALVLSLIGLPLMILLSLVPWLLRLAGVVLLVKALLEKPLRWEGFMPAVVAFLLSGLIRWIF